MKIILLDDVSTLGRRGDVRDVADGYARNYLLPQKLAIEASSGNKKLVGKMTAAAVCRSTKEKTGAEDMVPPLSRPNGLLISGMPRMTDPRVVTNARRPASQIGHGNKFWLSVLTENWLRLYRLPVVLKRSFRNGRSKRCTVTAQEQGKAANQDG